MLVVDVHVLLVAVVVVVVVAVQLLLNRSKYLSEVVLGQPHIKRRIYVEKNIVQIKNLKVILNDNTILNLKGNINIYEGDIVGIIGENGAGKTTLINTILGEIPYQGMLNCEYNKKETGVQFQYNHYNKLIKVYEIIQIVTGVVRFDENLIEKIKEFDIESILKKRIGKLSGGEIQRLTFFLVMYKKPKIFFFDELTTGLDFEKRRKILNTVRNKTKNKTVLTITHYFEELVDWANKLLILNKGEKVFFGSIEKLKEKYKHYSIIKVKSNVKLDIVDINNVIEKFDDNSNGIIIYDPQEQKKLTDYLINNNIEYQVYIESIYTLYSIAIYKVRGKNNEDA